MFNPDMYETPNGVCLFLANKYLTKIIDILEPAAGTGLLARYFDTLRTDCVEIDLERYETGKKNTNHASWYNQNFFDFLPENNKKYDLVVSNPPYGDAVKSDRFRFTPIEFIEKSASLLKEDGLIVFVLESDYFRSVNRYERFKNAGIFLTRKIDIVGRLKFIQNGEKTPASASRYHSIFEFSTKQPEHPILETIKL